MSSACVYLQAEICSMRKGILLAAIGLLIVIINILVGLFDASYDVFNNILVNFSILSSTVMFFMIFSHARVRTFSFGLSVIFGLSGLTKICFSIFSDDQWRDNLLVFLIMVITLVEALIIMTIYAYWKNKRSGNSSSTASHA